MSRDYTFEALVLRRFPVGEAHRSVTFLTRERGLLSAIAHGAAKSTGRLKLLTTPLRHVRLKAYHDPVADSWKVVDLEGLNLLGGLGEVLERSATASFWTELLLASWESGGVFDLFAEALSLLDTAPAHTITWLDAQVLWRALDTAGLMPDFSRCSQCGEPLAGQRVRLSGESGDPLCPACGGARGRTEAGLSPQALDTLLATLVFPLGEALAAPASTDDADHLEREGVRAWERALGRSFRSLRLTRVPPPPHT
ncbi:MAG: DNA repair protein RecO [Spirochaetales bacterium]